MARKKKAEEEPEEPSGTAGACVLVVLSGVVVAVVFRVSVTVGILALWLLGTLSLWRAARRRMSDSSATPPPPSGSTLYAAHGYEVERVQEGPGEGMTILYPVRGEEVSEA
ncbi:hypothetical protein ACFYRN_09920 [Streptomyces sp. NPDC005227]|uniref:hypothetical protein n=1 Tax=Streptomyces sp. NPDC005227 TaxID=3364707 RepID=UPI003698FE02